MTRKKASLPALFSFLVALAASAAVLASSTDGNPASPPKTTVTEVRETVQGTEIVDPYRWLEDQNSPETRAWIDAQNAYSDSLLSKLPGREALQKPGKRADQDRLHGRAHGDERPLFFQQASGRPGSILYLSAQRSRR